MRKFFPKVVFSTSTVPPSINGTTFFYDFNGNGVMDGPYILQGHECLVFFLGGIPVQDPKSGAFGVSGFGKDPVNPFTNNIAVDPNHGNNPNPMYSANRQSPSFEFVGNRLRLDPNNLTNSRSTGIYPNGTNPGIPGYYDSISTASPARPGLFTDATALGSGTLPVTGMSFSFYVYFSSYGNGAYVTRTT